jgi:hypothetical protein
MRAIASCADLREAAIDLLLGRDMKKRQWQCEAAGKFGFVRVPTLDDLHSETWVRFQISDPWWRDRCLHLTHDHPCMNCPTELDDGANIWIISSGPYWWQNRLCFAAGKYSATTAVSSCSSCPANTHQSEIGRTVFEECPANFISPVGSTAASDSLCDSGYAFQDVS